MKVEFEIGSNRDNTGINFNPRYLIDKLIDIVKEFPSIDKMVCKYNGGYYSTCFVHFYTVDGRIIDRDLYNIIAEKINDQREFQLNDLYATISGWGERYLSFDLKRMMI